MPDFAIEATQLSKFYGEHAALRQVDFGLCAGDALALLGANGAGKTTLLHLLGLLSQPTFGSLRLFGKEIDRTNRLAMKASIGLLGHQTFLYDELTARENLEFFAQLYGLQPDPRMIGERLGRVGLEAVAGELVRHFSRGMRQRLAIARAFLHDPALLLLDEPFTGLDESGVGMLRNQLVEARAAGRTVVLSSHDVPLALQLATHVLHLERGRVARFSENEARLTTDAG